MIISPSTVPLIALIVVALSVSACAKTGSTLYTPDRVANARRNVSRYEWARHIRDGVVKAAREYVNQPDDWLWDLVTPQDIPRGTQVNVKCGCPKCGKKIEQFGGHPWKCDVINRPWKIECPSCGETFPKNDFGKFYESGKDENGVFRYEKADRSLLFNTDHPDPKDPLHTYGVDDTMGWKDDKGNVFRFIGYYGHYGSWAAVLAALREFRDAYVYTGDAVYAHKAGVLLYRTAQFYPDMDWAKWSKLGFNNSDGGSGMGKVYGRIWEFNVANSLMSAYDAVYSHLDDPPLLSFLSAKAGKPVDGSAVRTLIEKNIVREVHDSILGCRITGNEGMHQNVMATAAVVLDEPGVSDKWIDWMFANGDLLHGDPSGGNIKRLFDTKIDDDGMGSEGSPTYNGLWRKTFRAISDMLDNYPAYKGPRFRDFPKYRKMFETPVRLICLDRYIPKIGDTGKTGNPELGGITVDELLYAYREFSDPIFAKMAYYLNGGNAEGIHEGIFDPNPEQVAKDIEKVVKEQGPYVPTTEELPAYGLAILRSGKGEDMRALSLYYGRNTGHGHRDTLNIELFGLGLDLMPDIGYPEHATLWAPRLEWTSNTISHNTVVVDRRKQHDSYSGNARFVVEGKGASAAEVCADEVYPETSMYQRTVAMVDVSDTQCYVVDIFRVKGGNEHHYSLHGPEGEVQTGGQNLVSQQKGTLAGESVPLGTDLDGRETRWSNASGFQYLYDIRRDNHPGPLPWVEWKVKDTWKVLKEPKDIRLRMTLVSPSGDVVLAHGDPPQNKVGNPRRLTYVIEPHKSDESTFVTVIEPYTGASSVKKIERTDDEDTVVLKITLTSGRTDYVVSSLRPRTVNAAGDHKATGRFSVGSDDKGQVTERVVVP